MVLPFYRAFISPARGCSMKKEEHMAKIKELVEEMMAKETGGDAALTREGQAALIDDCWRRGMDYLRQGGFLGKWQEFEDMKVGRQWPAATPRTRHLPRPVFNIVELIVNYKTAQVLNENMRIIFLPDKGRGEADTLAPRLYTDFAQTVWDELSFGETIEQVVDNAATYGSGIWHFYWDPHKKGSGPFRYLGAMGAESLEPANCCFGNPQIRDVQKQPWIVIAKREDISAIRERAKANGLPAAHITGDTLGLENMGEEYRRELEGGAKATLLTRYWRGRDGKIWFAQSACSQLVTPPAGTGLSLYPLELLCWKIRKNSLYGVSEVEGLIPNQKGINFIMAMMMLSVQDNAWPKILAKPGALNQQLTNVPGEVVVDNYAAGEGIKYLAPAPLSTSALALVDRIYELTRSISGAHQVYTGEPYSAQMSGAAIVALQRAAGVPVEQIKKRYMRSLMNIGRIWEDFFKHKYIMERLITGDGDGVPVSFTPGNFRHTAFELKIDVGPGASYSDALMMSNLENFLDKGYITFEEALEFMPDSSIPFKQELLSRIKGRPEETALPE